MHDDISNEAPTILAEPQRKPWSAPRVIVSEAGDTSSGSLASNFETASAAYIVS